MGFDKIFLDRQLTAADPQDHKSSVRFATDVALATYVRAGNMITASSNGAMGANGGVTPALGNDLLLTSAGSQSDVDNGIWFVYQIGNGGAPFILMRRGDADADDLVTSGLSVRVEEGTFEGQLFYLSTPNPIVVNTTALVFENGGGPDHFSFTDIPVAATIPVGQVMLVPEDVQVEGALTPTTSADLLIAGELASTQTFENHSVAVIPQRATRVVQAREMMPYTSLTVLGDLVLDGDAVDVSPDDGNDILDKLTAIAPNTPAILGASSPVGFKTPAEARAIMDVYSQAEVDAIAPLVFDATITTTDPLTPESGRFYILNAGSPSSSIEVALPPSPVNGFSFGLQANIGSVELTGNDLPLRIGPRSLSAPFTTRLFVDSSGFGSAYGRIFFQFSSALNYWVTTMENTQRDKFPAEWPQNPITVSPGNPLVPGFFYNVSVGGVTVSMPAIGPNLVEGSLVGVQLVPNATLSAGFTNFRLGNYLYGTGVFAFTNTLATRSLLFRYSNGVWYNVGDSAAGTAQWMTTTLTSVQNVYAMGNRYKYDASGGIFTVTVLLADNIHGSEIEFKEVGNSTIAMTLAVSGGSLIETLAGGVATSVALNVARLGVRYQYDSAALTWRLVKRVF